MVFDTWGGMLSDAAYREFSLAYMAQIMAGLTRASEGRSVPRIVFTKGGGQWLELIADCGCDAAGLDWTTDIGAARTRIGAKVALQGNFDPAILMTNGAAIAAEARRIVAAFGPYPGHVFNLGHGIWQHTPPENVATLVDVVHAVSAANAAA